MPTPSAPPNTVSSVRSKPICCSAISTPMTSSTALIAFDSTTRRFAVELRCEREPLLDQPGHPQRHHHVTSTTTMPVEDRQHRYLRLAERDARPRRAAAAISGSTPRK